MKKLFIAISLVTLGTAAIAANELFLKNISTCTPYKTTFKSPATGEIFEKAVLGVKTNHTDNQIYCIYYTQTASNRYQLCEKKTSTVDGTKSSDRKVSCRTTDINDINYVKSEVAEKDYIIDVGDIEVAPVNPQY
jgi:hypothetical protein